MGLAFDVIKWVTFALLIIVVAKLIFVDFLPAAVGNLLSILSIGGVNEIKLEIQPPGGNWEIMEGEYELKKGQKYEIRLFVEKPDELSYCQLFHWNEVAGIWEPDEKMKSSPCLKRCRTVQRSYKSEEIRGSEGKQDLKVECIDFDEKREKRELYTLVLEE